MKQAYVKTIYEDYTYKIVKDIQIFIADKSHRWDVMKFEKIPCEWRECNVCEFQPERLNPETPKGEAIVRPTDESSRAKQK